MELEIAKKEVENSKIDQNNKVIQIQRLLEIDNEKDYEISRLRIEVKTLQSQSTTGSSQSSKTDSLQEELIKITSDFQELQKLNLELERKNQSSSIESQKLRSDVNSFMEEAKVYKVEISKMTTELNQSRTDTDILKSENSYLKEELSKLKVIVDQTKVQFETRLREYEMDKFKLEEQLKGLHLDFSNKCVMLTRANDDLINIERRTTQVEVENSNLKYKLASTEVIERDFYNAKRHIASMEAELTDNIIEISRLRSLIGGNNSDLGHITYASRPMYSKVTYSSYSDKPPELPLQESSMPRAVSPQFQQSEIKSDQPKTFIENPVTRLDQMKSSLTIPTVPNLNFDTSASKNNSTTVPSANIRDNNEVTVATRRSSSRKSIGSLLQNQNYNANYEEIKPLTTVESIVTSKSSHNNQSVSVNGIPFATEQSAAEISKVYAEIDKKLTYLMTERTALHEECEKLHQRGGKTLRERTRLTEVELRLNELNKEISSARKSLTSKPS